MILARLPQGSREEFRAQYEAAADAAHADMAAYPALRLLLRRWSILADRMADPGFWEAIEDAKAGRGRTYDLFEAIDAEKVRRGLQSPA